MQPIRILQVFTIMNRGGAETMIMNYYRNIDRNKVQFDFLVHRQEKGDYDDEIESLGGKIYRTYNIRPGNYKKYFNYLEDFLENHNEYKIIHSHINENSGFILDIAKSKGIATRIAHSHIATLGIDYKYIFRKYARFYLKNSSTHNFACGEDAGKWLFKKKPFTVINNAIDSKLYSYNKYTRDKVRNELGIDSKFVIGHVGRFGYQKNHDFLIDIFNEVYKINSNSVLLMIGVGAGQSKIREKVNALGLESNVRFLNLRTDVNDIMQAMDVFLFPSLFEGLPVTVIEAQASGLPCVLSDSIDKKTSVSDLVEYISLQKTSKFWATQVIKYNKDFKRKDMCKEIIKHDYDIKNNSKKLEEFYLNEFEKNRQISYNYNTDLQ